jgi:hypothetical protein
VPVVAVPVIIFVTLEMPFIAKKVPVSEMTIAITRRVAIVLLESLSNVIPPL